MKDSNYIVIMGWMMSALGLNGNALLAYALIYSHSQDGEGAYWGSLSHTADRLNISRRAAVDVLNRLLEQGHITKSMVEIDGVQRCMYRAVVPDEATPPRKRKTEQSQPKKVARDLRGTREGNPMTNRLIFRYPSCREDRDREVTPPPPDGIGG